MTFSCKIILVIAMLITGTAQADSNFLKEFKDNYNILGIDLLNQKVEIAEISNFVYEKDIATFTFESGKIILARPINGRATTALFIGKGKASIDVPSHVERQSLLALSGDSTVNEEFSFCLVRMSDDFDLILRKRFNFKTISLNQRLYTKLTKAQGEYFFRPQVMHKYDNYFQLMRSVYQRASDGYFWVDFNRYVYTFDPALPEQSIVSYEYEGGDEAVTEGAKQQRRENKVVDDRRMSDIHYPITIISQKAKLYLSGSKGTFIDSSDVRIELNVNRDSLRFFSIFLHSNLNVDSIYFDNSPVDYLRRGSFGHIGIILPTYYQQDHTINLRMWYHGKDYTSVLPFAADPTPFKVEIVHDIPAGYNYIAPASSAISASGKNREQFTSSPEAPFRGYWIESLPSGYDTIQLSGANGFPINIIKSSHINKKNFDNFVPDKHYRATAVAAIDFLTLRLGAPLATDEIYVFPGSGVNMPGLVEIPQVQLLINETGGLEMVAAREAARQWFGILTQPATDREYWILDALPDYLSLLFVRHKVGLPVFFGELGVRRDAIYTGISLGEDRPLATGERMSGTQRTAKGTWVLHMLRSLMYDLEKDSDRLFWKFVRDLIGLMNNQRFTNDDIIKLAEKHYGKPLDWFFHQWLYRQDIPNFNVEYKILEKDGQYRITGKVNTKKVSPEYAMPVVIRVKMEDKTAHIFRKHLTVIDTFELGPFSSKPKKLIFNELYSVLCKQKVKKK